MEKIQKVYIILFSVPDMSPVEIDIIPVYDHVVRDEGALNFRYLIQRFRSIACSCKHVLYFSMDNRPFDELYFPHESEECNGIDDAAIRIAHTANIGISR
jgi:hypothetical protein